MEDFERPKRSAMSDAELASELAKFPSDPIGIEQAQRLIASQQALREQDAHNLERWFDQMRERDDALSRGIIQETLEELFPRTDQPAAAVSIPEPTFTSEIPLVSRRKVVTQRLHLAQFGAGYNRALLLTLITAAVGAWLGVSGLDLLISFGIGGFFAIAASHQLRSHELHPLLRSAAVFGGRGVYWFAPLVLIALGLLILTSVDNESRIGSIVFPLGFQAVVVLLSGIAVLASQLLPSRFHALAFGGVGTVALAGFLLVDFEFGGLTLAGNWLWASLAIAISGFVALTYGMPHLRTNWRVDLGTFLLGALFVLGLSSAPNFFRAEYSSVSVIALLLFSLAAAGRDIAGGAKSRILGLSILISTLLSPLGDEIDTYVLAVVSAAVVLLMMDQLIRRQPLHLASLDTSYGFYGAFQLWSWLGLAVAGFFGHKPILELLPDVMNATEWSLVLGSSIGLIFAVARIGVIRHQDLELENIDPRNSRLENLLGL